MTIKISPEQIHNGSKELFDSLGDYEKSIIKLMMDREFDRVEDIQKLLVGATIEDISMHDGASLHLQLVFLKSAVSIVLHAEDSEKK